MSSTQIIEHIVLFKVKPDTDSSKVDAMVNGLNALISLDQVLHLTAGPIHRFRSSSLTFTHMLHIRFQSKHDLSAYSTHPSHVSVVEESKPIIDDIMAVDWVADKQPAPAPGSAMRITFLRLKVEREKAEVLGVVGGMKDKLPCVAQISFGENFSPDRAKGFSIGSILGFPGLSELEALDSNAELKEKVGDLMESAVVVDYVIPSTHAAGL